MQREWNLLAQVCLCKLHGLLQADSLVGFKPTHKGHAIEVRLNAEDPFRDFAPSAGTLGLVKWPECSSETGRVLNAVLPG